MEKNKWMNLVSGYAILYTALTLLNSVLYLANGIYEDPSGNWHELDRAAITFIGILTYVLCTKSTVRPYLWRYAIAYLLSQSCAFVYVWLSGFREELAKSAYRDIWINFTGLFVLLCIFLTVGNIWRDRRRN